MSKNKGFSDTSANRYSLALYELASESNSLPKIEENSHAFLKLISSSKDFYNLIKDPTVTRDSLNQVIEKITDNFSLEGLFKNFLNFLISKRRFFYVQQILKNFNEICSEKKGELKAEIKSAKNLTQDEINKITQELSNNEDFKNFVKDPTLSRDDLLKTINKISESFKLEKLFKNFISFLITKRRFFYVEQILKNFKEICSEKRG